MRVIYLILSFFTVRLSLAAGSGPGAGSTNLLSQLTPCTIQCLANVVPQAGCNLFDIACQCNSPNMTQLTVNCMLANCTINDSLGLAKVDAIQCNRPHDSRNSLVKGFALLSGLVGACMIALRIFARLTTFGHLWMDDWFHMAGAIFAIPFTGCAALLGWRGFGLHLYDVKGNAQELLMFFYICQNLWSIIILLIKFSILCLYLRLFPYRHFHYAVYTVMAVSAVAYLITAPMMIFQCSPVRAVFDLAIKRKKCLPLASVQLANASANILTEIAILILPLPMLRRLGVEGKKMFALYALFGAGTLVIAVATARLPSLLTLSRYNDPTYDFVPAIVWTCAEITVAHICAAAPAIRTLFSYVTVGSVSDKVSRRSVTSNGNADEPRRILSITTTQVEKGKTVGVSTLHQDENYHPLAELGFQPRAYTTTTITATNPLEKEKIPSRLFRISSRRDSSAGAFSSKLSSRDRSPTRHGSRDGMGSRLERSQSREYPPPSFHMGHRPRSQSLQSIQKHAPSSSQENILFRSNSIATTPFHDFRRQVDKALPEEMTEEILPSITPPPRIKSKSPLDRLDFGSVFRMPFDVTDVNDQDSDRRTASSLRTATTIRHPDALRMNTVHDQSFLNVDERKRRRHTKSFLNLENKSLDSWS